MKKKKRKLKKRFRGYPRTWVAPVIHVFLTNLTYAGFNPCTNGNIPTSGDCVSGTMPA